MAIINSPSTGQGAEVSSSGELSVALTNNSKTRIFSENDDGTILGTATLRSPETSNDYRLRIGVDTMLFTETFNATAQNTSNWSYTFNTLTASLPGAGTLNFGTVQGTTSSHGAYMKTFQYFPVVGTAPLSLEFTQGLFTATLVANENVMFGLGNPTAATTEPTDGAWIRITTVGMVGEVRFNGTTTTTSVMRSLAQLTVSTMFKTTIVVSEHSVYFWLDDVLIGTLNVPAGNGQPFIAGSLPVFMMKYNTGTVSNTNTWRVSDLTVSLMDLDTNLPYAHQQALAGLMAYQGQNGTTVGSTQATGTITTGSSTNPTTAAGSNTAAASTGLGGVTVITAAAGANTDYIATSYQVPAATINITGRNLIITGVRISSINTGAAVVTTPTTLQWAIGYGHTAVSMQTAETGSFATGTTKTPRRIFLGFQSVPIAAAIGAVYAPDLVMDFQSAPIVVHPGEFINTHFKQLVGTATASQSITSIVTFTGYWV
jgi:hypothetical protein